MVVVLLQVYGPSGAYGGGSAGPMDPLGAETPYFAFGPGHPARQTTIPTGPLKRRKDVSFSEKFSPASDAHVISFPYRAWTILVTMSTWQLNHG